MILRRHGRAGFTLLEMLVVMILTGMITTLLLQGLQQVFRLQSHFGREIFNAGQGAMQIAWFRQTVNGIMPDFSGGKHQFNGQGRRFDGITNSSLHAPSGSVVPFGWRLQFDSHLGETLLIYGVDGDAPAMMSWHGNAARFIYLDAMGAPHDSWPPFPGKWPQLPMAIRLDAIDGGSEQSIMATLLGPANTLPNLKDAENQ